MVSPMDEFFPEDATWVDHSEIEAKYPQFQP